MTVPSRSTKIVCTVGPASNTPGTLRELLEAGASVFRINASHGDWEAHNRTIAAIREVASEAERHPAILLDLQGPKIRLGKFEGGTAVLADGAEFTITTEPVVGNAEIASTSYARFARDVRPGDRILLADGAVTLEVIATDNVAARCRVVAGGVIGNNKGINLPGVNISTPSITDKDRRDIEMGLDAGIDLVALSFVRKAMDIRVLRQHLKDRKAEVPLIAKIEKPEALDNIDEILEESDGIMVARGDLGVEMALEKVPLIQKSLIDKARRAGKFVITATQMLESMITNPWPTRAEVSDVANAILDGTDAVMLSAETSTGKYPVEAVRMTARIADETEGSAAMRGFSHVPYEGTPSSAEILADAAYHAAQAAGVKGIVVFTHTGFSARLISRYRPHVPVYAFTASAEVARRLAPIFGVWAIPAPPAGSTDEMLSLVDRLALEQGLLERADSVVFIAGQPMGRPGTTNLMKLHRIGETRG